MFPISEISKNQSKDFKTIVIVIALAWITATAIGEIAKYKLAKTQKKLADTQIKKLESEGFKIE